MRKSFALVILAALLCLSGCESVSQVPVYLEPESVSETAMLTLYPTLGERARNNGKVVYSLDFEVTPHQLRHTYITNLIYSGVDPKTVQYLAGHENSKITMDIYAKAKYNRPKDVAPMLEHVFNQWNKTTKK